MSKSILRCRNTLLLNFFWVKMGVIVTSEVKRLPLVIGIYNQVILIVVEVIKEIKTIRDKTKGEKDAEALRALGFAATTNPMGAASIDPSYAEPFRGCPRSS